jgi:hypothetical protein
MPGADPCLSGPSARAQGTTYVVPQFHIFVCTDCSGVQ